MRGRGRSNGLEIRWRGRTRACPAVNRYEYISTTTEGCSRREEVSVNARRCGEHSRKMWRMKGNLLITDQLLLEGTLEGSEGRGETQKYAAYGDDGPGQSFSNINVHENHGGGLVITRTARTHSQSL